MLMLFLTVAMVHIVALMSPGPDFFFVSQTAVSRSRKEAMMGVLGITCGVMVWAGIALLGLHLIIETASSFLPAPRHCPTTVIRPIPTPIAAIPLRFSRIFVIA